MTNAELKQVCFTCAADDKPLENHEISSDVWRLFCKSCIETLELNEGK